jgi:long-chain acyl-CoA synthetase
MPGFYARFLESIERWPQNIAVEMQREDSLESHSYAELRQMAESVGRWLTEQGVERGSRCVVLASRALGRPTQRGVRWHGRRPLRHRFQSRPDRTPTGRLRASVIFTDRKNPETAVAPRGLSHPHGAARRRGSGRHSLDAIPAAGARRLPPGGTKPRTWPSSLHWDHGRAAGRHAHQDNLLGEIDWSSATSTSACRTSSWACCRFPRAGADGHLLPLSGGARVVYLETLNTAELLRALRERQVTIFVCVPQFFYLIHERVLKQVKEGGAATQAAFRFLMALSRLGRKLGWNLGKVFFRKAHEALGPSMRYLITGGSRFDSAIGHDLDALGFDILQAYGLTETSGGAFATPPLHNVIGSVCLPPGRGTRSWMPSPRKTTTAKAPPVGEVAIRGRIVMQGYYNRPDLSALALRDGWLHTGDLGYFDSGGNLFITGRRKEVIVLSSGKNISPEDVEQHYLKCQWVKEMCVISLQSRPGEPVGCARRRVTRCSSEHIVNTREVIRWSSRTLPAVALHQAHLELRPVAGRAAVPPRASQALRDQESGAAAAVKSRRRRRLVSADDQAWLPSRRQR